MPEKGTRRRIYLKGEKEVDITTHRIPVDQNSPNQDRLSHVTMFNDLQKVIWHCYSLLISLQLTNPTESREAPNLKQCT